MPVLEFPEDSYALKPSRLVRDALESGVADTRITRSLHRTFDFRIDGAEHTVIELRSHDPESGNRDMSFAIFIRLEPDDTGNNPRRTARQVHNDNDDLDTTTNTQHWRELPRVAPIQPRSDDRMALKKHSSRLFLVNEPIDWVRVEIYGTGDSTHTSGYDYDVFIRTY